MKLIIVERRELTKQYYELKYRLDLIDHSKRKVEIIENKTHKIERKQSNLKNENEYQQYMLSKKKKQTKTIPYQIIGLSISSILKEADRPLSNKEIYTLLRASNELEVSYKNLTINILPKIDKDCNINVERAYRGYWQYRLKKI
ncbi:hypothetical protein SOQ11_002414 [Enterococcus faecalis]|nr:hypothetical protein [Enterococcus faecalis]